MRITNCRGRCRTEAPGRPRKRSGWSGRDEGVQVPRINQWPAMKPRGARSPGRLARAVLVWSSHLRAAPGAESKGRSPAAPSPTRPGGEAIFQSCVSTLVRSDFAGINRVVQRSWTPPRGSSMARLLTSPATSHPGRYQQNGSVDIYPAEAIPDARRTTRDRSSARSFPSPPATRSVAMPPPPAPAGTGPISGGLSCLRHKARTAPHNALHTVQGRAL